MDPAGDSAAAPPRRFGAPLAHAVGRMTASLRHPRARAKAVAAALPLVLVPLGLLGPGAAPAAAALTQAPLVVQASTTTPNVGMTVSLSATGGSGTGQLVFQTPDGLQEPECMIVGSSLQVAGVAATCHVEAFKYGDAEYASATSDPLTITFTQTVQDALVVTSTAGAFGTPLTLSASGGSTDAPVTFSTEDGTASGCTVGGAGSDVLTSSTSGTCIVTAAKAGSGSVSPYYADATSLPTPVTLVAGDQLLVTSTTGLSGQPLALATVGGTGTGEVSYTVVNGTATDCAVSASVPPTLSGWAGTCIVTATKASDGTSPSVTSAPTAVTLLVPQSVPLQIAGTSWNSAYPMPLAAAGGNSGGEVTYTLAPGSPCLLSATAPYTLSNPGGGVCTVTATRESDGTWAAESSAPTVIQFSDVYPVVTTMSLEEGVPTDLTVVGGTPRDVTTFSDAGGDCSVVSSWVVGGYQAVGAPAGGVCLLRITQNDYNAPTISWPTIAIPVLRNDQAALTVTSTSGTFGTPLALASTGGSGEGRTTYSVADGTASGCTISLTLPYSLSASSAGTCTVTAAKAGDLSYTPTTSPPMTVTLGKANQATLTVTSTTGTYGSPLTLTTSGGSGSGAVTYTVTDGTAGQCTVTGDQLTASSAGTCEVQATKAGDPSYTVAVSAATTVTLAKQATSLVLKHDPAFLAGSAWSMSATLLDGTGRGIAGREVTLGIGTGVDRRSCTATTASDGVATCAASTSAALGPQPVDASFAEDADYLGATSSDTAVAYGLSAGGTFVIGDKAATAGGKVTFWGSSWATANPLSGSTALTKFKGFASKVTASGWSTGNGPSGNPPASVPLYLLVDVTSQVTQSGSTFAGDVVKTAVVQVDPGYGAKNSQTGTGTVVALLG